MKPRLDMTSGALRASVFLLVLMLFLSGANLLFTSREVGAARAAAASITQLCQAANVSRAQQVSLWDHVLTISANSPPPLHETPAQKRQRLATARAFIAYVHRVFAPLPCTKPPRP